MWKFIFNKAPVVLFVTFLAFYVIQIPETTCKTDVITFAVRSLEETPVIDFAYLDSKTLLEGEALPNYHLGHTLILWFVYKILTPEITHLLWPSAFISALSASLAIVLTYLIWLFLGISRRTSLFMACVFGLIPIFWEHAVLGEVHALQMFFTLLFLYAFLKDRLILSTFAFLMANLISPLSGLAFSLILLKGLNKKNILVAIIIGGSALIMYFSIFMWIGADFMLLLNPVSQHPSERGFLYRLSTLIVFILLNFNLFIYYLFFGIKKAFKDNSNIATKLLIGIIPQLVLIFVSAGFFIEYGSFQLLLFWALSFPIGLYLAEIKLKSPYFIISIIFSFALTYSLLLNPHKVIGSSLEDAGEWLLKNRFENHSIIGPYHVAINIIQSRNGNDLYNFNNYFHDHPNPEFEDIIKTNKSELILAHNKKISLRKVISNLNIPGMAVEEYNPIESIKYGVVTKIFENNFVTLYQWKK